MQKILIVGLGNLLLGDEGVGIHVIYELKKLELPRNVALIDGGTAAFDLIPLLKDADKLIIVDAVQAGEKPGAIYRFRPEAISQNSLKIMSLHQINLKDVLSAARLLNIEPETVIIGIEPKRIEYGLELSEELKQAIPQVIKLVQEELASCTT